MKIAKGWYKLENDNSIRLYYTGNLDTSYAIGIGGEWIVGYQHWTIEKRFNDWEVVAASKIKDILIEQAKKRDVWNVPVIINGKIRDKNRFEEMFSDNVLWSEYGDVFNDGTWAKSLTICRKGDIIVRTGDRINYKDSSGRTGFMFTALKTHQRAYYGELQSIPSGKWKHASSSEELAFLEQGITNINDIENKIESTENSLERLEENTWYTHKIGHTVFSGQFERNLAGFSSNGVYLRSWKLEKNATGFREARWNSVFPLMEKEIKNRYKVGTTINEEVLKNNRVTHSDFNTRFYIEGILVWDSGKWIIEEDNSFGRISLTQDNSEVQKEPGERLVGVKLKKVGPFKKKELLIIEVRKYLT